jgi:hypothetical protein
VIPYLRIPFPVLPGNAVWIFSLIVVTPEISAVDVFDSIDQLKNTKSSKEREMDAFLDKAHKKKHQ